MALFVNEFGKAVDVGHVPMAKIHLELLTESWSFCLAPGTS